ncbi:MAG: LuxR C-terminal-related transcriptional regulator [Planctomycetota bacterium]|jgi:DNA-binding NarL/FixJ family response regulator
MQDITAFKVVTPAEKKVLQQLVEGKSNSEVAYALGRSVHTIEDHRARYMSKLGADNLLELIERAKSLRSIRRNDFQQEDST